MSGNAPSSSTLPEPPRIDIETHGNALVPITVGSERRYVPLRDVLQRHPEVTRLQQQLAEVGTQRDQYRSFFNQIKGNPQKYLPRLAEEFGYPNSPQENGPEEDPVMDEEALSLINELRAEIKELREEQSNRAAADERRSQAQALEAEYSRLAAAHPDFDREAVTAIAMERRIPLEDAYFRWSFGKGSKTAQEPSLEQVEAQLGEQAPGQTQTPGAAPAAKKEPPKDEMEAIGRALAAQGIDIEDHIVRI